MDREDKAQVRDISKMIKQGIRDNKRSERHEKIRAILEEYKGSTSVAGVKTRKKKVLVTHMRNESGNIDATRKGIANVFAAVRTAKQDLKTLVTILTIILNTDEQDRHIPEFTRQELMTTIDSLEKRKSADSKGIKAEDIK